MAVRYRYVFKTGIMEDKTISARLIYRKIKGKLSAAEEERFDVWLKEGWEHREYYERMQRMYQEENMQEVTVGKIQDAWEMFEKRVQWPVVCREETALDVGNECCCICGGHALFGNVLSGQHEEGREYSRTKYCAGTV